MLRLRRMRGPFLAVNGPFFGLRRPPERHNGLWRRAQGDGLFVIPSRRPARAAIVVAVLRALIVEIVEDHLLRRQAAALRRRLRVRFAVFIARVVVEVVEDDFLRREIVVRRA